MSPRVVCAFKCSNFLFAQSCQLRKDGEEQLYKYLTLFSRDLSQVHQTHLSFALSRRDSLLVIYRAKVLLQLYDLVSQSKADPSSLDLADDVN